MSEISVMSQVLNEQIANMKRSIDKFSKVCSKVIEEFGTCTNETGNEVTADEDTISRKQAIDVCFNGWNKDYRAIIEDIKLLPPSPSRLPEPHWIPCSERLPNRDEYIKNNGLFNVSDGNRSYSEWFDVYDKQRFGEPTMYGFRIDYAVAAWMPLPEPYKGVDA